MKTLKRLLPILIAIVLVLCCCGAAVWICLSYFDDVSKKTYTASVSHLKEVYAQVNKQFRGFVEKNWGLLDDYSGDIPSDGAEAYGQIEDKKSTWGFSQFFFLAKSDGKVLGTAFEKDGDTFKETTTEFELKNIADALFADGKKIISNEPTVNNITLFAVPASGICGGKPYSAIAVSYTNALFVERLSVETFSENAVSYIIDADGNILLASYEGGSVLGNYLDILDSVSDIDETTRNQLAADLKAVKEGVFTCGIGKDREPNYVVYRGLGYQNLTLLGRVPIAAANATVNEIQAATIDMLIKVFIIVLSLIIVGAAYKLWQTNKRSASELRYREKLFDVLNIRVDDIFIMLDAKTLKTDYLSPNIERLLGIAPKEALDDILNIIGSTHEYETARLLRSDLSSIPIHECSQRECSHLHKKTGERRWFLETVYHELVQGVEKYIAVLSDRTAAREMNERLEHALGAAKSANEAKSHFLSNMSHDIRTPMNAIIGLSVLLAKDAENPEKVREYTRKITSSGQHLLSLVNDVLDMSKIESGKTSLNISEFSLPEVLDSLYTVISPQAKAKKQTFEIHAKGCPPDRLLGDKMHLNQILLNLLSNAIKYTGVEGKVDFTVQGLEQTVPQHATIRFIVADNGFGMSKEFLRTVFDPFSREVTENTRGVQGTGLGMAITKNLVDLMGGVIDVQSEIGKGSTFTVDISFAISDLASDDDFWARRNIKRVLVADDDELVRNDIQTALIAAGLDVVCVNDGKKAAETAIAAHKDKTDFDVILLDWKMPVMTGVEAAREIRKKIKTHSPLLVLSSFDWSDIEDDARAAGVDAFMTKPFFVSAFKYVIEAVGIMNNAASEDGKSPIAGMKFLAAEDNEINAEILGELITGEGATCDFAENGKEAFERFTQSEPNKYDMILMDVQMPIMNGYEATRAIRASKHPQAKTIPIIAMTANAFAEDVKNALDAGMNAHLSKPIDMAVVRTVISRFIVDAKSD